jgi:hypothetical protein
MDVTAQVRRHVEMIERIIAGDSDLLRAGDEYALANDALNLASFAWTVEDRVILRQSSQFVNHLYSTPGAGGAPHLAVVSHNGGTDFPGGAITASLAEPVPGLNIGALMREMFGPEAGGHAGIGGSVRGAPMPFSDAIRLAEKLAQLLREAGR